MAVFEVKPIGKPDMTRVKVRFHFWADHIDSSWHEAKPGFNGLADRIIDEAEKALLNKQNMFTLCGDMYGIYKESQVS